MDSKTVIEGLQKSKMLRRSDADNLISSQEIFYEGAEQIHSSIKERLRREMERRWNE